MVLSKWGLIMLTQVFLSIYLYQIIFAIVANGQTRNIKNIKSYIQQNM